ncbi:16S rRNA (adenine(1518)-N(6)/adenine(1519)-N(6))-dimethyltransferase RsmA [Patescibacteria group bacterium]|nr:16S rRNA (adenine(1518)-N(6)/adenine(1519)-N(6))-dimethyltransferase RsmA [Patescibacteria group bacterium]
MNDRFVHKKSLGQHFLNSPVIPRKLCDAADLIPGETVVEIGPGTGALTAVLLERGVKVIAIETDERAILHLEERFATEIMAKMLVISAQDARELDLTQLGLHNQEYKVVANIPYYLSGFLFRTFLENTLQPSTLVFLVQKEVAERIARAKKASLLSLSVAVFGNPTYICTVKRGNFTPAPKVDSAIIAVRDISRERLMDIDPRHFFYLLHLGFGQKRKQLLGNLTAAYERTTLERIFNEQKLNLNIRAEDLSVPQWVTLVHALPPQ